MHGGVRYYKTVPLLILIELNHSKDHLCTFHLRLLLPLTAHNRPESESDPILISGIISSMNCSAHKCNIQTIVPVPPDVHSGSLFFLIVKKILLIFTINVILCI